MELKVQWKRDRDFFKQKRDIYSMSSICCALHLGFFLQVEFCGGPFCWSTRTISASAGGGAYCNGQKIHVSQTDKVEQSLLVTGFGYEHDDAWTANINLFKEFTDISRSKVYELAGDDYRVPVLGSVKKWIQVPSHLTILQSMKFGFSIVASTLLLNIGDEQSESTNRSIGGS